MKVTYQAEHMYVDVRIHILLLNFHYQFLSSSMQLCQQLPTAMQMY